MAIDRNMGTVDKAAAGTPRSLEVRWGIDALADHPLWQQRWVRWILVLVAAAMFAVMVSVPLDISGQIIFSAGTFLVALLVNRLEGRFPTLVMLTFSVTVSCRYMYWRITDTLGFENWWDALFGFGLLLAELYALLVLLIGYFQTAWPLRRQPVSMPADLATWPSIDVFIPTYNEPLEVVRQTVFSAMRMDWPEDRLHIFLLDDGRREEFRSFCAELGVAYLTRDNNQHAKAGNINAALAVTNSEYVAIFDCDHIPTRSFLQVCMGWFARDPKLAMLQTPHTFFSPDPFEKNLETFHVTPNEGELFYGVVQDGNDLWNASFFCGSCAVIKRKPLMEIGGIAVETVTEDAHTALKLSRRGYNTAYLELPQAAGLATESLSAHVGQRIRWARGMAQIFRVDNPLLGPGLKLGQRLCYMNAMAHFFYGLPRLVFLTAPLAYLFFGAQVFQATALLISAYALPHIAHSSLTNSRIQGRFRYSFWNEVYESVLAWYIMRPVLLAVVNPKMGKFNVTSKGGLNQQAYFDWSIARPYLILLIVNFLGLLVGIVKLIVASDSEVVETLIINMIWTFYNIVISSASLAVASETRQVRSAPRVTAAIPAALRMADGKTLMCQTDDFSQNGLGLRVPQELELPTGSELHVTLFRSDEEGTFPAQVMFSGKGRLGLSFKTLSLQQQVVLTNLTFSRADAWMESWGNREADKPLTSLKGVIVIGVRGLGQVASNTMKILRGRREAMGTKSSPS